MADTHEHSRTRHSRDERRDEILRAVIDVCAEQGARPSLRLERDRARRLHRARCSTITSPARRPAFEAGPRAHHRRLYRPAARVGPRAHTRAISRGRARWHIRPAQDPRGGDTRPLALHCRRRRRRALHRVCRPRGRALRALYLRDHTSSTSRATTDVLIDHVYETFYVLIRRPHPLYPHATPMSR